MGLVEYSPWDTEHFGFRIAQAEIDVQLPVSDLVNPCIDDDIKMLICKCDTGLIELVHSLVKEDFGLMGTSVIYAMDIGNQQSMPVPENITVRSHTESDTGFVTGVAEHGFLDYRGHFHADPRLEKEKCGELYRKWAYNSCVDKGVADEVLVAEIDGRAAGYLTIKIENGKTGSLVLAGVHENARGKGVYQNLIAGGINWCISGKLEKVKAVTQLNNYIVQRAWSNLGMRLDKSIYIFHKWFNEVR